MARYTGPVCRLCRREGMKLFLKGIRCYTKCPLEKKNYPPGMHGRIRRKLTPYSIQLREKQKLRRIYGVLEKQFSLYFERASRLAGPTGENLLKLLEKRLDNVLYRAGFAWSRPHARQIVNHGHVRVNDRKVDIPSFEVSVGDVITFREKMRENTDMLTALEFSQANRPVPPWLSVQPEEWTITITGEPTRDMLDFTVQEHMIVELYSK